ncbi:MAG: TIGR02186 family protein [Bacillota bacterium]
MRKWCISIIPSFVLLFAVINAACAEIGARPESVKVGLGFSGSIVTVTGTVPAGSDVCLRVISPPVRVPLNRQGKVAVFWMSVQKTIVEGVPKLYHVYTSSSVKDLPVSLRKQIIGYRDATVQAKVTEKKEGEEYVLPAGEAQPFVKSLVELYEKKGLYAINEGKIKIENGRFTADVAVPVGTPQGRIEVTSFFIKNGRVVAQKETSFDVQSVGLVRWLRQLSGTDGPVYGGLAVMIALFAGAAVGMAFSFIDRLFGKGRESGEHAHAH